MSERGRGGRRKKKKWGFKKGGEEGDMEKGGKKTGRGGRKSERPGPEFVSQ